MTHVSIPSGDRGVVVVADDLTGAADTAVHFLGPGEEMLLVSLATEPPGPATSPGAGLAIDTRTRGASRAEAVARVQEAARRILQSRRALVYKKVDSQLRGRPGLEIETLRRALGLRCALVAPAHPDQERVTRAGVHFVHGVPVTDAEAGRDPVAPVTESRLSSLVAAQAGVEVGHIPLAGLDDGPDALSRRIEALVAQGTRVVTFDAVTPPHLDRIAEAASRFPDALLAGSAGLAIALAARWRARLAQAELPRCDSMLFVCGSTSGALRRQAVRLIATGRCRGVALPSVQDAPCREDSVREAIRADGCDVVLQAPEDRLDGEGLPPPAVLAGLAACASAVVARRRPDGVFLSGGDTATAVLDAAGVVAIRLRGEAMPGVAWGVAIGGTLEGATILTRSGAFGADEDLVELHRRCRRGAAHD